MPKLNSFEELECWQDARGFTRRVYDLLKREAFRRDYDLVSQIRRSAVSVMANIAEGFHRYSRKDFLKFLDYAAHLLLRPSVISMLPLTKDTLRRKIYRSSRRSLTRSVAKSMA